MKKFLYLSIIPFSIIASCASEIKEENTDSTVIETTDESTDLLKFEDVNREELSMMKTMRYTKGEFSTEIEGYFENDVPVMFNERYMIENGNSGTRDYFLKKGQLTHVIDYHEKISQNDDSTMVEESIFYYENSELVKMTYRKLNGIGDFEMITPQEQKDLPNFNHTAYLNDFLNKQGDFETAFIDIAEYGENGTFLRVGTRNEIGYECYIKIDQMNETLEKLKNNKEAYKGKLLNIDIAYTDDPFMHLMNVSIAE